MSLGQKIAKDMEETLHIVQKQFPKDDSVADIIGMLSIAKHNMQYNTQN